MTISLVNLIMYCFIVMTMGVNVGRWQNRREAVELSEIQRRKRELAIKLGEMPRDAK